MMLGYDMDRMNHQMVSKLQKHMDKIDVGYAMVNMASLRVLVVWLQALTEYVTFKKYCNENGIEFEMTRQEYPHGMFSAT